MPLGSGQDPGRPDGLKITALELVKADPALTEMLSLSSLGRLVGETGVLLLIITALQASLFAGVATGPGIPHPYWIPVLLASAQYGVLGGVFAAVASTIAYFLTDLPPQTADLDFYAYVGVIAGLPAAWMSTALVLGGLRNLHIRQLSEVEEELQESKDAAGDLAVGLEDALAKIRTLEKQIAVDSSSVSSILRNLSRLDMTDQHSAAVSFGDLIRDCLGAAKFTIYLNGPRGFEPVHAVDAGFPSQIAAIPSLDKEVLQALLNSSGHYEATANERDAEEFCVLIRSPASGAPLGAVLCASSDISRDMKLARKRLEQLCCAFGAMLSVCPRSKREARVNA